MGSLPFLEFLLTTGTIEAFGWHKGVHGSQCPPIFISAGKHLQLQIHVLYECIQDKEKAQRLLGGRQCSVLGWGWNQRTAG